MRDSLEFNSLWGLFQLSGPTEGGSAQGFPLAFALFRIPWALLAVCGYDSAIFRISGPGSLSLGLRDLSAYSVGSSIGSRSFKLRVQDLQEGAV